MKRRFSTLRSLPVKLLALLSLALLPLGLISLFQTYQVFNEAEEVTKASLKGRTLEAANAERELIQEALGATQGLGSAISSVPKSACRDVLTRFVETNPNFVFAGFAEPSGEMTCTSSESPLNLSGANPGETTAQRDHSTVIFSQHGHVTDEPVIVATSPILEEGAVVGFLTASIPLHMAEAAANETGKPDQLKLVVINSIGSILASTGGNGDVSPFLPRDIPLSEILLHVGQTFESVSAHGEDKIYSITSLVPESVALMGIWSRDENTLGISKGRASLALLVPVLMWLAGMTVAYFGLQRLVIRHITSLRSAMRRYALGELRGGYIDLGDAPEELKDTERAFNRMVLYLDQADAQREQDLRDKEVLLREVHHRVKNNLQLIASIMNMQSRTAKHPETRRILAGIQRRVRGLAMLHRSLYTTPDMTTVNAADMIAALVDDMVGGEHDTAEGLDIKTELASTELYPDQAVPLSMLLAEALTNALKYAGIPANADAATIGITLKASADNITVLTVSNSKGIPLDDDSGEKPESTGLGSKLMRAFVSQLEGTEKIDETGHEYTYSMTFVRRDFELPAHK